MSAAVNTEAASPGAAAPPVETPVAVTVPEPTGPGTSVAAQEQLRASDKPPASLLTEGAPAEAEAPAAEAVEAPEAFDPEKITFPEGFAKNDELFGKFSEIAKAGGLTLPVAQQLADLYATATKSVVDANRTAWATTLNSWETEVRADPEIAKATLKGENGTVLQGLDAAKVIIARAILDNPEIGGPKLRQALEDTGGGSNLAIIRSYLKVSQLLTEGSAVRAGGPSPNVGARSDTGPQTSARALYPNLP